MLFVSFLFFYIHFIIIFYKNQNVCKGAMHYYTNPAPERRKHFIFIENKMRNSFIKIKK